MSVATATPSRHTAKHTNAPLAPSTAVTAVSTANRRSMPIIAGVVDSLRQIFGPVRVIFASEGGKELGQEPPPGVVAHPPHVPSKSRKRGTV